jgi:dihydropteroate synthase
LNFQHKTLNCLGQLLVLDQPVVMGILNVTPDSFFDGGQYEEESAILLRAAQMIEDGATILDIGGLSTRPGSKPVDAEEEIKRVVAPITAIKKRFPEIIISIDTYRVCRCYCSCRSRGCQS